jgi:adenylate cyclase
MKSAARRGVERAEKDLILHPDNPRSAYLGSAALVALGDNDRAREWLSRALAIDPTMFGRNTIQPAFIRAWVT